MKVITGLILTKPFNERDFIIEVGQQIGNKTVEYITLKLFGYIGINRTRDQEPYYLLDLIDRHADDKIKHHLMIPIKYIVGIFCDDIPVEKQTEVEPTIKEEEEGV